MNKRVIIIISVCILVSCAGAFMIYFRTGSPVVIDVKAGMSARDVAGVLKSEGIISSQRLFVFLLRIMGADKKIKKGTYRFDSGTNIFGLIGKFVAGKVLMVKLTVPEGFTSEQIAELVEQKEIGDSRRFMNIVREKKLEGYLFPETYLIPLDSAESDIIDAMVKQFNKVFTDDLLEKGKKYRFLKEDIVILASIIEREAKKESERKLISAVFHNRLKRRYYLESCATVQYILGKHRNKLTYEDLEVDSPYNTYRNFGLPPGPICNPGLNSLAAAVDPEETDMMFFVSNGDGTHKFSSQYKKHLDVQRKK